MEMALLTAERVDMRIFEGALQNDAIDASSSTKACLTLKQVIRTHRAFVIKSMSDIFGEYSPFPNSAICHIKELYTGSAQEYLQKHT